MASLVFHMTVRSSLPGFCCLNSTETTGKSFRRNSLRHQALRPLPHPNIIYPYPIVQTWVSFLNMVQQEWLREFLLSLFDRPLMVWGCILVIQSIKKNLVKFETMKHFKTFNIFIIK